MQIVLTACDDPSRPNYAIATLQSYFESDACDKLLHVSVHGLSACFLGEWQSNPNIKIHFLTPEQDADRRKLAVRARVVHATSVALSRFSGEVMLLQDDVVFAPGWYKTLTDRLASFSPDERALSLVTGYSHLDGTPGFRELSPAAWWGLQAFWMGSEAREAVVKCLELQPADWNVYSKGWGPGMRGGADVRIQAMLKASDFQIPADDVRIQQMLLKKKALKLWGLWPSLVNHMGHQSSIGSPAHQSPTFGNRGLCDGTNWNRT